MKNPRLSPERRPIGLLPLLAFAGCLCIQLHLQAQSLASCPGVIISHVQAPSQVFGNPVYVGDPCILVLSNGHYLAAHALFGSASGSGTSGKTRIFRSTDQGATWTKVNGGNDLTGILRGTLFEQGGAVYLLGSNKDTSGNVAVISKSTDNGTSWSAPSSLSPAGGMATPDHALPVSGRLWAATTTTAFSATASSDLMQAASWTRPGGFPASANSWLPGTGFNTTDNFIGEGQMTYSPGEGLVILPKVRLLSYTAIARVNPVSGVVTFDPDRDFVPLPGGEKKFGVRYDAVSGKYFLLGNPILPAHAGSSIARDLIRNTAAVFTSSDLRTWKLEKIFLYSANLDYEGFQYFNFDFDGNDIVIAARTAFDVGGNKPPRGHDSNLLTFHRIPNFRNLTRDLYLKIEGGQVRRYERTQHTAAPLGVFPLGPAFAGQALVNPEAMGVSGGTVYIREPGGRILNFDLLGNFLGVVGSAPGPLSSANLDLPASTAGETTWGLTGSGSWADPQNWRDWNVPGAASDVAVFGSAATSPSTVTLDRNPIAWTFETAGNLEGWTASNIDSPTVAGGVFSGLVQSNGDPYLARTNLNFSGSDAPEVRVRLRINTPGSVPVDLFWGNSLDNSYAEARRTRVNYTGNGSFQEITFPMAVLAGWSGERITRLRIDPANGAEYAGKLFEIDSVSVQVPGDLRTLGGLRFTGPNNHTLAGSGALRIAPASGFGRLEATQGNHAVSLPVQLGTGAVAAIATGSSLTLSGALSGNQSLTKTGGGTLTLTGANTRNGPTTVSGGRLAINSAQLEGGVFLTTGAVLELGFTGTDSIGDLWLDGVRKWKGTWGGPDSGATYQTITLAGTGTLTVTAGPEPGYDGWAWRMGLTGAPNLENGANDDPDHDSLPNALEWILGGDPLVPDLLSKSPQLSTSAANLVFTFSRDDATEAAATCFVEYGPTLQSWSGIPVGAAGTGPHPGGIMVDVDENGALPDLVRVVFPSSFVLQDRLFVRLKTVL
jgi:autotransporter-associated beta strand protein